MYMMELYLGGLGFARQWLDWSMVRDDEAQTTDSQTLTADYSLGASTRLRSWRARRPRSRQWDDEAGRQAIDY